MCRRKNHFRCFAFALQDREMMIKSKFYKHNGDEFPGLSAVWCKKKDLEGKILQGLFCEKIYAISAKVGLQRNIE